MVLYFGNMEEKYILVVGNISFVLSRSFIIFSVTSCGSFYKSFVPICMTKFSTVYSSANLFISCRHLSVLQPLIGLVLASFCSHLPISGLFIILTMESPTTTNFRLFRVVFLFLFLFLFSMTRVLFSSFLFTYFLFLLLLRQALYSSLVTQ